MRDKDLYEGILGRVVNVVLDTSGREVRVEIENKQKRLPCPVCAVECMRHDSRRRRWPLDLEDGGTLPVTVSQAYRYQGEGGRVSQRQTRYNLAGTHNAFTTGFAYDDLGNLSQLNYPRCHHYPCANLDPALNLSFGYTRGFLSSVAGCASSLTYQQGGMLHQVSHANNVVETIDVDPVHPFDRPYRIQTSGVTTGDWDSRIYRYDGSGNVRQVGTDQDYRYDRMSRLLDGGVEVDGVTKNQSQSYDAFGNILSITTDGSTLSTAVSSATNRLNDPLLSPVYDAGGNFADITLGGERYVYTYDPLNMMKHLQSTTDQARVFLYDADDERVMTFDCVLVDCATQTGHLTTTIRGLDGKVLRVYNQDFGQEWDWLRDYVYRDGLLLAAIEPNGAGGETISHFHLDHLGTPRQITGSGAVESGFHAYYPFGSEATDPDQDGFQLKFTGHERDGNGGEGGVLDYMHARYYSNSYGRFLSVDPVHNAELGSPQAWNGASNETRTSSKEKS